VTEIRHHLVAGSGNIFGDTVNLILGFWQAYGESRQLPDRERSLVLLDNRCDTSALC